MDFLHKLLNTAATWPLLGQRLPVPVVLRMLATLVLWGAGLAVLSSVPGWVVRQHTQYWQAELAPALNRLGQHAVQEFAPLQQLAASPALTELVAAQPATTAPLPPSAIRRILFGFSLANSAPHLVLWHGPASQAITLPSTFGIGPTMAAWLDTPSHAQPFGLVFEGTDANLLTRVVRVPTANATAVMQRVGLTATLVGWPWPSWHGDGANAPQLGVQMPGPHGMVSFWAPSFKPLPAATPMAQPLNLPIPGLANLTVLAALPTGAIQVAVVQTSALGVMVLAILTMLVWWSPLARGPLGQVVRSPLQRVAARWPQWHTQMLSPLQSTLIKGWASQQPALTNPRVVPGRLPPQYHMQSPHVAAATGSVPHLPTPPNSHTGSSEYVAMQRAPGNTRRHQAISRMDAAILPEDVGDVPQILQCLANKGVHAAFQPIYAVQTLQPIAFEVLARFTHVDGTSLPTTTMLQQAREEMVLDQIDANVLMNALHWLEVQELAPGHPLLSLNIAPSAQGNLAYLQILMESAWQPLLPYMMLEVMGREILTQSASMLFLKDCQKLGVKLAIDYFGGGTAMLDGAAKLKFDYVKIDARQFSGSDDARSTLINLGFHAKKLKLPLILEKIENIEMERVARQARIDYVQGYLFAPPAETPNLAPMPSWQESLKTAE